MRMKKISPVWQRYGAEVRKRRKVAGLTQSQLGRRIALSSSAMSYIENGKLCPQADHSHAIDAALEANGALVRMWENYTNHAVYPVKFRQFIDFERVAVELHEYQNMVIPGLVQTPDYARAIFLNTRRSVSEPAIERLVEGRMQRQAIFERQDRPLVSLVVEESAVRRVVETPSITKAQLAQVIRLSQERKIQFQVIPQSLRSHPGLSGLFRVYIFKDRPTMASAEYMFDEQIIDDTEQVRQCMSTFGALQAEALSPSASIALIQQIHGELDE